ncbi:MAG TPA: Hsp20/alpha crystallin family protein [bacterium]|nr:Hsp20/alpha crystallin family protein [bacterium]HPL95738.1 Hsp20/alpha crystallin family protein [bacterium]
MTNFFSKNKKNKPIVEESYPTDENFSLATDVDEVVPGSILDTSETEGQLSVDVYQTQDEVIIKSTIAGVKPEDIDISIDNDTLTIRGSRQLEEIVAQEDYFYQECYWGGFSRSVVLPLEVKSEEVEATLKNGVLTIVLPKAKKNKSFAVKVKSE